MTRSKYEIDRDHESPNIDVALSIKSFIQRGQRDALKTAVVLGI